ncbi:MAG: GntG family PLP-dependent aldolase, partial [Acidimicrobiales bacterium]
MIPAGRPADFGSDTVTRATPEMREAMAAAPVGDDVWGDDPTVNRLQEKVAELTGMEAALFFSSGTQSNLSAVLSQCGRGDEYLAGSTYHLISDEAGGAAVLGGVVPFALAVDAAGSLSGDAVREAVKVDDPHYPITRLLALENTVSGMVQPEALVGELAATARTLGLRVHLDGARLFNAVVATGHPLSAFTRHVDTVSLCLSKGLGAPIGSVLAGDRVTIGRALRIRKMLGGAMRQVGHIAAAGIHVRLQTAGLASR